MLMCREVLLRATEVLATELGVCVCVCVFFPFIVNIEFVVSE